MRIEKYGRQPPPDRICRGQLWDDPRRVAGEAHTLNNAYLRPRLGCEASCCCRCCCCFALLCCSSLYSMLHMCCTHVSECCFAAGECYFLRGFNCFYFRRLFSLHSMISARFDGLPLRG
ncbi:hypothetical protein BO99DRAFT_102804 [Aspergillus violaceofuscus CBS 115571]|uniref:Uncharacterized protein n=1 Tax=Aspergillus violaceofuscus (strain CBS 115571) TaxID=1450538 RepID=A0A2V5HHN0_ASPV1|nr:hypothetical protein BO99DRAFT_102804 [Aspergillus violaceofuscus CBS 115571]